jgi:hypothetical protein
MPTKRVPLGKGLDLSVAEMDAMAETPPEKVAVRQARSNALWKQYAPRGWETLLDAQPIEAPDRKKSLFVWDTAKRQYKSLVSGRYFKRSEIRKIFDQFLRAVGK